MQSRFHLHIRAQEKALREWLSSSELPDFSVLISKLPEEQFTLQRRGYFVEDESTDEVQFAIDAELKTFQEVDGQWEPQFDRVRKCVHLKIQSMNDEGVEVEWEINAPKPVQETLRRHLESLLEEMKLTLEAPKD